MLLYCHICNTCHRNKEHCHWTVLKALGLIFSCPHSSGPTVEDWVCQRTRCEIGINWWVPVHVIDQMVMTRVASAEVKSVPLTTERIQPDLTLRLGIELLVPIFQEKTPLCQMLGAFFIAYYLHESLKLIFLMMMLLPKQTYIQNSRQWIGVLVYLEHYA